MRFQTLSLKMKKRMRNLIKLGFSVIFWSCSHTKSSELLAQRQSEARPRSAAYGADGFYNERDFRQGKLIQPDDFFFKKCRINKTEPYPSMHQWECTDAIK
jgi:hypothetical protein